MLPLPETVECRSCGCDVEVIGWHECPRRRSDTISAFESAYATYFEESREAAFYRYLILRETAGKAAAASVRKP